MSMTHDIFMNYMNGKFQWFPFFKLTNLCNYQCAHCCERSGPDCRPAFIPVSDVHGILDAMAQTRQFMPVAVLSGGEPMTAYDHKSANYIPRVMNACVQGGYCIELKTNAGWTLGKNAPVIFRDLENLPGRGWSGYFAYHLSLDRFHPNAHETTVRFLQWYATTRRLPRRASVHIFYDDAARLADMFTDLLRRYQLRIDMNEGTRPAAEFGGLKAWRFVDSARLVIPDPYGGIDDAGRAHDNKIASRAPALVRDVIQTPNTHAALFFDAGGMAMPMGCDWADIATPYKLNGRIRPINQIKQELFEKMWQRYVAQERMMGR